MSVENNRTAEFAPAAQYVSNGNGDAELVYVGFWRRLAACAIDFAILVPYALLARQLIYTFRSAYLANMIISTILAIADLPEKSSRALHDFMAGTVVIETVAAKTGE